MDDSFGRLFVNTQIHEETITLIKKIMTPNTLAGQADMFTFVCLGFIAFVLQPMA